LSRGHHEDEPSLVDGSVQLRSRFFFFIIFIIIMFFFSFVVDVFIARNIVHGIVIFVDTIVGIPRVVVGAFFFLV
jgi:hypothetical protein